jgi:murein DD-endopeptidase MepM/ murein hydrolase activator NlpD
MAAPVHNPQVIREYGSHSGRDYRTAPGTAVRATLAGVVVRVGDNEVVVESNAIWHLYGDLSDVTVTQGETVETGDRLGLVAGSRLHYEERVAPYLDGDHRSPQFDLHTNARVRTVAMDNPAEERPAEPPRATVDQ